MARRSSGSVADGANADGRSGTDGARGGTDRIVIRGAREHNLKGVDLDLPRNRLIVVSGPSGSGKSSLAFDTVFAEGQRRYVESLSAYARQFLGRMDKPDVDFIDGLSPAISIEQRTAQRNPRSTVGTVTEIYDYLRLLFARTGRPHCAECGAAISERSTDQIVDAIASLPAGSRIILLAPVVRGRKGQHRAVFEDAVKAGFVRVRVDGRIHSLDDAPELDRNTAHTIEIVVDRLIGRPDLHQRVAGSVETALEVGSGQMIVLRDGDGDGVPVEQRFSQTSSCADCGAPFPELEPRLFSFNNPHGACPDCSGLGVSLEFDRDLIVPDPGKSFDEGGIATHNPRAKWTRSLFRALARHWGFRLDTPLEELPPVVLDALLFGAGDRIQVEHRTATKASYRYATTYRGVIPELKRRYLQTASEHVKRWLEGFMREQPCHGCGGRRLRREALAVEVAGHSIDQVTAMSVEAAMAYVRRVAAESGGDWARVAGQIVKEIGDRLEFMASVGLAYLSLDRRASTLSGGEAQRIRLATQIGSALVGVLYVLDEPTIGLHQRDNDRLLRTLFRLRDRGNTLLVVEHDEQTLRSADYLVDLGPGAGEYGGRVVACGAPRAVQEHDRSVTGRYLAGREAIPTPPQRRRPTGGLTLRGAAANNLRNLDVRLPLGTLTVVTGVSGSGKSTLVSELLGPALRAALDDRRLPPGLGGVEGCEHIDKVIEIDQTPIGRTPRSNPATYVGLFTPIRELFAALPEARALGYRPGRFSFNVAGGRCENCAGDGQIKIEMHFLPDVFVTCDVCGGRRYNRETLAIRYKGRNIDEVLRMSVTEAAEFFTHVPQVARRLGTLQDVGLGYLRLGQSALTLSGGEAQRVKLSLELSRRDTGRTVYLLDEPTTGLHFVDVRQLLSVLQRLVDKGNTVVVIEHHLDVIKQADHVIDLGPEGGSDGGDLVATGTPEHVAGHEASHTGRYLREVL